MGMRFYILLSTIILTFMFITGAVAQDISSLSTQGVAEQGALSRTTIQIFLLITVLSLAPGIAMMVTCLPFMIVVLSILRQAIGLQQAPPTMMIVSLGMFLTFFVMEPVFTDAWKGGVTPYLDGNITEGQAISRSMRPFKQFMESRVNPETRDALSSALPNVGRATEEESKLSVLIPSFMISEIERGFEIGFVIFLPFLIIDLLVASILMSMGMMMVPPVVVSLPFKIAFIVLSNGWTKIAAALVQGYSGG